MKISVAGIILATAAGVAGIALVQAAPEPAGIPIAWELDADVNRPQPIEVYMPGHVRPRVFWYMLYTVTNRTGEDRILVPEFVLYTDTGQVLRAGKGVPPSVFRKIKTRHNEPLLRDLTAMTGRILQGRDNAKLGVAIWPDFDPKAGAFDVFVGGLSGEAVDVKLPRPVYISKKVGGKIEQIKKDKIVLSKTLRLHYSVVGETAARIHTGARQVGAKTWLMR